MFVGCGIRRLALPLRDEECGHVEIRIADGHRQRAKLLDLDADLLAALAPDGLLGRLTRLDVSADEIPAIGIPAAVTMPMTQKSPPVAHENGNSDRDGHDDQCAVPAAPLAGKIAVARGAADFPTKTVTRAEASAGADLRPDVHP